MDWPAFSTRQFLVFIGMPLACHGGHKSPAMTAL